MRLKNNTDQNTDKLKEMIRHCKPNGVSNFDITFKNTQHDGIRGRAYYHGCLMYHGNSNPYVVVLVGNGNKYPHRWDIGKGRGYIPYISLDQDEELVNVIAHELRHLWQAKVKTGHRVWGSRGRFSERDASCYAFKKMREWRKAIREKP